MNTLDGFILPFLETERLILRPQQDEDIASLIELWLDPVVTRYLGGPRDRVRLEEAFAETAQDPLGEQYDLWPVKEKDSNQIVGHCGLLEKEVEGKPEIELIYLFSPQVWGCGYAVEISLALIDFAARELGHCRLIAIIEPENRASARVAEKLGFQLEKVIIRPGGHLKHLFSLETEDK